MQSSHLFFFLMFVFYRGQFSKQTHTQTEVSRWRKPDAAREKKTMRSTDR